MNTEIKTSITQDASIAKTEQGWVLGLNKGDVTHYRNAQIYNYYGLPRRHFPHHSLTLSLVAKTSSNSLPGTWGFGLWNDPFGMSLGFGATPFRLPALPNAIWFFGASNENYLSFSNKPGNGFLAQSFRSPNFHPLLMLAGLAMPFSRKLARTLIGKVIVDDGITLSMDTAQWHKYKLEWSQTRCVFWVDNVQVFESAVSPNPPLGLVIWIDNQYASFTSEGKIGFGVLKNPEPAWLEIKDLKLS